MKEIRNESVTYLFEQALRSIPTKERRSMVQDLTYLASPEVVVEYHRAILLRLGGIPKPRSSKGRGMKYGGIAVEQDLFMDPGTAILRGPETSVLLILDPTIPDPRKESTCDQ